MNVTVENVNAVTRKLTITVPGTTVKRELDTAFRNLQTRTHLKGFRPGKVPRSVLEDYYGQQVAHEVTGRLVSNSLEQAISDHNFTVVSQPTVEPQQALASGKDLVYIATIEVKPEIVAQDYTGIEIVREVYPIEEGEVERRLTALQEQKGQLIVVEEERSLQGGDFARIDYSAWVDGRPLEKNMPRNTHVAIQPGSFLPGFDEQVTGMNKGEVRKFDLVLPDDFPQKPLAGKTITVEVTLHDIKRRELPALDDEFAKDNGAESLAGLRENIQNQLKDELAQIAEIKLHRQLATKLIERNNVELPSGLIDQQIDLLAQEQRRQQGLKPVKGKINLTDAQRQELGIEAAFRLRTSLILESVASLENLVVTEEDLNTRLEEIAEETHQKVEAVRGLYIKNNAMDDLRNKLLEEKALELVIEKAAITEEPRPLSDAHL